MPRRRRRRSLKFKMAPDVFYSLVAIVLLVLSGILFLSLFTDTGSLNSVIKEIMSEIFGRTSYFIPFFLAYFGLLFIKTIRFKILQTRILVGIFLFYVSFSGLLAEKGGLVGMKLRNLFYSFFGGAGSKIVLLGLFVMSILITFNVSLDKIISILSKLFPGTDFKFLNPSFIRNLFPSKELEGEMIEVSSKSNHEDTFEEVSASETAEEKDFEVVPNIAEPIGAASHGSGSLLGDREGKPVSPTIPYVDRVWEYPSLDLLSDAPSGSADRGNVKERAQTIERALDSFGIRARVVEINMGPAVTQYALESSKGTKIARITNLANDLALALASPNGLVRIEAPIPGKSLIGIEVPNFTPSLVSLKSILSSDVMKNTKSKLAVALGHDVAGKPYIADIGRMPHVLVAGSTGSGKSVLLNSFISTLLFRCSPNECKIILVDPKRVEFSGYTDIPHLLTPIIVESEKAIPALKWAVSEMERRYKLFENAKVRNIDSYNEMSGFQALPYIVIFVDELAELMGLSKMDVEKSICRLAQKSRATGIHLILATQRPSVDVLTGLIKANIPCRISFNVTSQIDSRVIIDMVGAEKLLGRGDMLYVPPDVSKPTRIQGSYISDSEIGNLVNFIRNSSAGPDYLKDVTEQPEGKFLSLSGGKSEDAVFKEAVEVVVQYGKASSSLLQRKLSIGYAKAARLLDEMEEKGIVSSAQGSRPRDILINDSSDVFGEE